MNIIIVTPAPPGSRLGNRITAVRWQRILRGLGHRVRIAREWRGEPCDVLVALHATKSRRSIVRYRRRCARGPLVLALTGTDVYGDLRRGSPAYASVQTATRIVVLQREALRELGSTARGKARVILQSALPHAGKRARTREMFGVTAVGHLRAVKDPLLAARAARLLPASSRIRIEHFGAALDAGLARAARNESRRNARWRWRGQRSHAEIMRVLARSQAFVQTSTAEGGSSAMSEAIVSGLPILSTRIPGAIGMLGAKHPGYFEVGDEQGLAALLARCERDARFLRSLIAASSRRAPLFTPEREREAWRALLGELERQTS